MQVFFFSPIFFTAIIANSLVWIVQEWDLNTCHTCLTKTPVKLYSQSSPTEIQTHGTQSTVILPLVCGHHILNPKEKGMENHSVWKQRVISRQQVWHFVVSVSFAASAEWRSRTLLQNGSELNWVAILMTHFKADRQTFPVISVTSACSCNNKALNPFAFDVNYL